MIEQKGGVILTLAECNAQVKKKVSLEKFRALPEEYDILCGQYLPHSIAVNFWLESKNDLPEKERKLIYYRLCCMYNFKQCAEKLGVSERHVMRTWAEVLKNYGEMEF